LLPKHLPYHLALRAWNRPAIGWRNRCSSAALAKRHLGRATCCILGKKWKGYRSLRASSMLSAGGAPHVTAYVRQQTRRFSALLALLGLTFADQVHSDTLPSLTVSMRVARTAARGDPRSRSDGEVPGMNSALEPIRLPPMCVTVTLRTLSPIRIGRGYRMSMKTTRGIARLAMMFIVVVCASWSRHVGAKQGEIRSGLAPYLCLDVRAANPEPGTKVQIWQCNGSAAQQWTVMANGRFGAAWLPISASMSGPPIPRQGRRCDLAVQRKHRPAVVRPVELALSRPRPCRSA
jgi:hypothetical protein